jgi:hypothetical protein
VYGARSLPPAREAFASFNLQMHRSSCYGYSPCASKAVHCAPIDLARPPGVPRSRTLPAAASCFYCCLAGDVAQRLPGSLLGLFPPWPACLAVPASSPVNSAWEGEGRKRPDGDDQDSGVMVLAAAAAADRPRFYVGKPEQIFRGRGRKAGGGWLRFS